MQAHKVVESYISMYHDENKHKSNQICIKSKHIKTAGLCPAAAQCGSLNSAKPNAEVITWHFPWRSPLCPLILIRCAVLLQNRWITMVLSFHILQCVCVKIKHKSLQRTEKNAKNVRKVRSANLEDTHLDKDELSLWSEWGTADASSVCLGWLFILAAGPRQIDTWKDYARIQTLLCNP